jgi:hypothetical protein
MAGRVSAGEAAELVSSKGHKYLDVRWDSLTAAWVLTLCSRLLNTANTPEQSKYYALL